MTTVIFLDFSYTVDVAYTNLTEFHDIERIPMKISTNLNRQGIPLEYESTKYDSYLQTMYSLDIQVKNYNKEQVGEWADTLIKQIKSQYTKYNVIGMSENKTITAGQI